MIPGLSPRPLCVGPRLFFWNLFDFPVGHCETRQLFQESTKHEGMAEKPHPVVHYFVGHGTGTCYGHNLVAGWVGNERPGYRLGAVGGNGLLYISDLQGPTNTQHFYRAVLPP
jgi:hypothetical protein